MPDLWGFSPLVGRAAAFSRWPKKSKDTLLLGSWNIANFGLQVRRDSDLALIAEMLAWFDVVAVQECREHVAEATARQTNPLKRDATRRNAEGLQPLVSPSSGFEPLAP